MAKPTNLKELRGFFDLTGYYCRFVEQYGTIAGPFTHLLKRDEFVWIKKAAEAFEKLKKVKVTFPVLALSDFSQPFTVKTDASRKGLGAVLSQNQRLIAYFSPTLSHRAQLKPIYERELIAVVLAVQRWRRYLLGQKFIVRTDQ